MAITPIGMEPLNIKKRLEVLFQKLNDAYPDKNIVGLYTDHKKWGETVTELYRLLGYPDGRAFLEAYGYTYGVKESIGGRPKSTDPEAIIKALQEKYPTGSSFTSADELFADNPEYLPKLKTLKNTAKDVFGMSLGKYLLSIGLIKQKPVQPPIKEVVTEDNIHNAKLKNGKSNIKSKGEEKKDEAFIDITEGISMQLFLSLDGKRIVNIKPKIVKEKAVIKIPSGIEIIEDDVFMKVNIEKLFIPKELKRIGKYTLLNRSEQHKEINSIVVEEGNDNFYCDGIGFYSIIDGKKQLEHIVNASINNYIMPEDVTSFTKGAFDCCNELDKIVLSDNIDEFDERYISNTTHVGEVCLSKTVKHLYLKSFNSYNPMRNIASYHIDEENEYLFRDEDSIYEVLEDGSYKLITNQYMGKGKISILEGTSIIGKEAFAGHSNFKEIELPKSVKIIEESAFANTALKALVIPDTVQRIESNSFSYCNELKSVQLSEKLEYIAEDAFKNCWNLNKIKTECKKKVFIYENGVIRRKGANKKSVDKIEPSENCVNSILEEEVDPKNQFEYSINGEEVILKRWIGEEHVKKAIIPSEIDGKPIFTIHPKLFIYGKWFVEASPVEEVIISEGIKRLETSAFYNLKNLKKVVLPESLEYIDTNVFADDDSKYKDLYIRDDIIFVAPLGSYADKFLKSYRPEKYDVKMLTVTNEDSEEINNILKMVKIFEFEPSEQGIVAGFKAKGIFALNEFKEKKVVVPDFVNGELVKNFEINGIPNSVQKLSIPATVTNLIGINYEYLFSDKGKSLKTIEIDADNPVYWSDGFAIFSKDKKTLIRFMSFVTKEYTVPEGTEKFEKYSFGGMKNLETLVLPRSMSFIDSYAFYECNNLSDIQGMEYVTRVGKNIFAGKGWEGRKSIPFERNTPILIIGETILRYNDLSEKIIRIPKGITKIGEKAFGWTNDNDQVEEIVLPESACVIESGAFSWRKKLKKINIPEGVKEISEQVFSYCENLETLYIPSSVEKINIDAFPKYSSGTAYSSKRKCTLKAIDVSPDNKNYCSINGMLLSKDKTNLLFVPNQIQKVEIPMGVNSIGENAFSGNTNLEEIVFPEGVKVIDKYAFYDCENLRKIILPDSLKRINDKAFYNCKKLKDVTWSKNLEEIGEEAFCKCGLSNIALTGSIIHIGSRAFANTGIKKVSLPKSVRTVGVGAFSGVSEIEIYDTIDPEAMEADARIDTWNVNPNSTVGCIGKGDIWETGHYWKNYTIIVKSSETDEIKYKVWMGADSSQSDYYCFLASAWGHNATFAFKQLDEFFLRIRGNDNKKKVALYRLEYPYELSDKARLRYENYIKNNS